MKQQSVITFSRWLNVQLCISNYPKRVTHIDVFASAYKSKHGEIDKALVVHAYQGFVHSGVVPRFVADFIINSTKG